MDTLTPLHKRKTPPPAARYVACIYDYDDKCVYKFYARSYVQLYRNVIRFIVADYAINGEYTMSDNEIQMIDDYLYNRTSAWNETKEWWTNDHRCYLYYGLYMVASVVELTEPEFSI